MYDHAKTGQPNLQAPTGSVSVQRGTSWILFEFSTKATGVTGATRVTHITVGKGRVLHYFADAC